MTATQEFIEDAIKGGSEFAQDMLIEEYGDLEIALLKPEVWQAVGKTRGWGDITLHGVKTKAGLDGYIDQWRAYMHRFIDHLADGDDIETALSKLV